jgi:hypothetical protein
LKTKQWTLYYYSVSHLLQFFHTTSSNNIIDFSHVFNVADVFLKFRDDKGNIVTDDARCLLLMYEAAHLRVKGEEILDNILIFTKSQL